MHSEAWQDRALNSALGGWAESLHSARVHEKNDRTPQRERQGAWTLECERERRVGRFPGYVEPLPEIYRRLRAAVAGLHARLRAARVFERIAATRGWPPGPAAGAEVDWAELGDAHFLKLIALLTGLESIARKELRHEPLDVSERVLLRDYGVDLKHLAFDTSAFHWNEVSRELRAEISKGMDVADDPCGGGRLAVGVQRVLPIYVIVPADGGPVLCRGAVYSYQEWVHPPSERMTDRAWSSLTWRTPRPVEPWIAGRGLGLDPAPDPVPFARAEVARVRERLCSAGGLQGQAAENAFWDAVRPLSGRPPAPEAFPELFDLAHDEGIPGRAVVFAIRNLRGWRDPRARDFLRNALATMAQRIRVRAGHPDPPSEFDQASRHAMGLFQGTVRDLPGVDYSNPLQDLSRAEREILESLLWAYTPLAGPEDLSTLRDLWVRWGRQRTVIYRSSFRWPREDDYDFALVPLTDMLVRLDPDGWRKFFGERLEEPAYREQAFHQMYRLAPPEAVPALLRIRAVKEGQAPEGVLALLADDRCPGGRAKLYRYLDGGALGRRYFATQLLLGLWPRSGPELWVELESSRAGRRAFEAVGLYDEDACTLAREVLPSLLQEGPPRGLEDEYAHFVLMAAALRLDGVGPALARSVRAEIAARRFGAACAAGVAALGVLGGAEATPVLREVDLALRAAPPEEDRPLGFVLAFAMLERGLPESVERIGRNRRLPFALSGLQEDSFQAAWVGFGSDLSDEILCRVLDDPGVERWEKEALVNQPFRCTRPETLARCARASLGSERVKGRRFEEEPLRAGEAGPEASVYLAAIDRATDPEVRRLLIEWASWLDDPEVCVRMRRWAGDADPWLRRRGIRGLGSSRSRVGEARAALMSMVDEGAAGDAADAALALRRLDPAADLWLFERLDSADDRIRIAAAAALAARFPEARAAVGEGLASPDPWVRAVAAVQLAARSRETAVPVLVELVRGRDPALTAYVRDRLDWLWAGEKERSSSARKDPDTALQEIFEGR